MVGQEPMTPAARLLEELILNDRHLREHLERRARRDGLTLRERVKAAFPVSQR